MTDIPDCTTKQADGSEKAIPGTRGVRFNVSLGQDGRDPGCTMRTVKEITGLPVDHFMMVDFNAVKTLSTAVGGVKVCVARAVEDPDSHLDLPAGESTIEGRTRSPSSVPGTPSRTRATSTGSRPSSSSSAP